MLSLEGQIEGLLFIVGDEGLSLQQIAEAIPTDENTALEALEKLHKRNQSDSFGCELVAYAGVYKFVTKSEVKPVIERVLTLSKARQLSQSALETLAIVAYKQPITRLEIEEIRGVGCDMMCRKLVALDLIREAGRSESIGRPILYEVTKTFLDSFKLTGLEELPDLPDYSEEEHENIFK